MSQVEQIITELSPQRLEQMILGLAAEQPPGERDGVAVSLIVSRLSEGHDLGTGAKRSQAYQRLKAAVQANVAPIEGMKYIKSSD